VRLPTRLMSMSRYDEATRAAVGRVACRIAPVIAAVLVAVVITFDHDFGGYNPEGLVIVVSLPLLAWAILAPRPWLALAGGLLLVPGVAVWAALLNGADWLTSPRDTDLQRGYPSAASAAVVLALAVAYAFPRYRRPRLQPSSPRRLWIAVRIVVGVAALLAGAALAFDVEEDRNVVAVVVIVPNVEGP
jgi:hypothetical protein